MAGTAPALLRFSAYRALLRVRRFLRQDSIFFGLILRGVEAFRAIVLAAECFELPSFVLRPDEWQHLDRPGCGQRLEGFKRLAHDFALELRLMRFAGGMAQREVKECGAWRIDGAGDVERAGHT